MPRTGVDLTPGGSPELTRLVAARDGLRRNRAGLLPSMAAARTTKWTLPVVHVRPTRFTLEIVPPPDPSANQARLEAAILEKLLTGDFVRENGSQMFVVSAPPRPAGTARMFVRTSATC